MTAFTSEYEDTVAKAKENIEKIKEQRQKARYTEIVDEANGKIAEAEAEVTDAQTKLENGKAEAAAKLLPVLTQDETSVFKRGRNAKVNSVPHNADIGQYHAATGLEALFGWLYLLGRTERINELFNIITGGADDAS